MKNKLSDLNNYLFEQIERLMDDEVCKDTESTQNEIRKTGAIVSVAQMIVANGSLQLATIRASNDYNYKNKQLPDLLQIGSDV